MVERAPATAPLNLRFLGEFEVLRGSERLTLPPSKKTRALLAYLALTGRPHRRDRLCGLLWDVTDDPRAALRWSLSKLRAVVDDPDRARIASNREMVAFEAAGADVDVLKLRRVFASGVETVPTKALIEATRAYRGEFLEGLDLADFRDFHAWCIAEREQTRVLHARVLTALLDRLAEDPEAALPHARALVQVDPLSEIARARLVRILGATGRRGEAEQHVDAGRRLIEELRAKPTGHLEAAWREVRAAPASLSAVPNQTIGSDSAEIGDPDSSQIQELDAPDATPLVGREPERALLTAALSSVAQRREARVVLLTGEPGVGKTRLLGDLADAARRLGGTILDGRAFEAENGRPYGPWIDVLRRLPALAVGTEIGRELAPLVPEFAGRSDAEASRDGLFGGVVELIAARAASAPPVVLLFDDFQWCDEASAVLLHYVARMCRHRALLVALSAREGELEDNAALVRVLASIRHDRLLEEIPVGPLDAAAIATLARAVDTDVDGARVFAESAGNPLYALELARSLRARTDGDVPHTLAGLVRDRVARVSSEAADVLRWAAVLGGTFDIARLQGVVCLDFEGLVGALEILERRGLLREESDGRAVTGAYQFVHDVVRRVVYAEISEPRRRLMHGRVAAMLEGVAAGDEAVTPDLARHAALAGQAAAAARACVAAGRRSLRLFANEQADAFARKGMRYAEELPEAARVPLLIDLIHVSFVARRPADPEAVAARVEGLAERALDVGAIEQARLGFHMLAYLRWEGGEWGEAERVVRRAELVSRGADERDRLSAMAEAARCLAVLERDLGQAQSLVEEASDLERRTGRSEPATADAMGLLRQHAGRLDEAAALFGRGRTLARLAGDRLEEFQALEHLVRLEIQRGRSADALGLADELVNIGDKLREGSEAPFARVLRSLAAYLNGERDESASLDAALRDLRAADAKHRLAYALTRAAEEDLRNGVADRAKERSSEALAIARALGQPSEIALAHIVLARAASAAGDDATLKRQLTDLATESLRGVSAEVREVLESLLTGAGGRLDDR